MALEETEKLALRAACLEHALRYEINQERVTEVAEQYYQWLIGNREAE